MKRPMEACTAAAILRRDGYRTVPVEAGIADDVTAIQVFEAIRPWMEAQQSDIVIRDLALRGGDSFVKMLVL